MKQKNQMRHYIERNKKLLVLATLITILLLFLIYPWLYAKVEYGTAGSMEGLREKLNIRENFLFKHWPAKDIHYLYYRYGSIWNLTVIGELDSDGTETLRNCHSIKRNYSGDFPLMNTLYDSFPEDALQKFNLKMTESTSGTKLYAFSTGQQNENYRLSGHDGYDYDMYINLQTGYFLLRLYLMR